MSSFFKHSGVLKMTIKNLLIIVSVSVFCYIFRRFIISLPRLVYWCFVDFLRYDKDAFNLYGVWMFTGKQGSGKTMSLVYWLEKLRKRYPKVKIYTNMGYKFETEPLKSLNDLLDEDKRNGTDGTIFVIDEIQNEFSASTSKNFPESVLSLVTQQRKNHVLILTTSQVFTRVSKPLREQCYRAIECRTIFNRYTMNKHYDGIDYADAFDKSIDYKSEHRKRIQYESFVQTDKLRNLFDSYQLIDRLSRIGFAPKLPSDNSSTHIQINNHIRKRTAR